MIRSLLAACFLLFSMNNSQAQIFPDLEGSELMNALIETYKPSTVLGSSGSKDSLYAVVENFNGQVECVYTGYSINLVPNTDPSQSAFAQNINQEHVFPRSKGVDNTPAEFDMHHLYPSRVDVNSDRGSLPFGECQDNLTNKWYINTTTSGSVPSSNIDGYSELIENANFEPRENRKGDIARAVFYVYTMYNDLIDQDFFENQKATLCEWHQADPVDDREYQRSNRVAQYQEDKPNPFVLDCTLAARLFCDSPSEPCDNSTVSVESDRSLSAEIELNIHNNGQDSPSIFIQSNGRKAYTVSIFNSIGTRVTVQTIQEDIDQISLDTKNELRLDSGIYIVFVKTNDGSSLISRKLFIQ